IRDAATRLDIEEGDQPLAIGFRWAGDPSYPRLHALAEGIGQAIPRTLAAGIPIALLADGDIGMAFGSIVKHDLAMPGELVSIDGVLLQEFDFVDVGELIDPPGVLPVLIKPLLFARGMERASVKRALLAAAKSLARRFGG